MRYTAPTILAFATSVSAGLSGRTFAVNHFYGKGPLMTGSVDPIISPGGRSGHVHVIQGGNAFGVTMTDTQALDDSTCTSSRVKNDKSNYWTPTLWFQDPVTKELEPVEMFYMNVYYFFEQTTDKITAFQPGHRMVIGNVSLRSPPASGGKAILDLADGTPQPVGWTCPRSNTNQPLYPVDSDGLHGAGIQDPNNKGAGVGFPDQNCDGYASPLRADIHFPSCYNPAAGLTDYKNNMQFPTNGNCPKDWIHTPHLFYEVYWNTPKFADRWTQGKGTQPFVLANGDPTGYSLHGDFISGWDVETLQQIIDNCDAGDSGMDKCPGLIGGLNDPSDSCNIDNPIQELLSGTLSALPGNNPITEWGATVANSGGSVGSVGSGTTASMSAAPSSSASKASAASGSKSASSAAPSSVASSFSNIGGTSPSSSSSGIKVVAPPASTTFALTTPLDSQPTTMTTLIASLSTDTADNTIITSYISETTIVWTTVTATGPAPTGITTGGTTNSNSSSSSVAAGWTYSGCFQDDSKSRILTGITFANIGQHAVSNTKCVAYCSGRGYSMAGTEYGGQCFCGNELNTSTAIDEAECDMPCEGDDSQTCGGGKALSVYSTSASASGSMTGMRKRALRHLHRHLHRGDVSN